MRSTQGLLFTYELAINVLSLTFAKGVAWYRPYQNQTHFPLGDLKRDFSQMLL